MFASPINFENHFKTGVVEVDVDQRAGRNLTDSDFERLVTDPRCSTVVHIRIDGCSKITEKALEILEANLSSLPNLVSVTLKGAQISRETAKDFEHKNEVAVFPY